MSFLLQCKKKGSLTSLPWWHYSLCYYQMGKNQQICKIHVLAIIKCCENGDRTGISILQIVHSKRHLLLMFDIFSMVLRKIDKVVSFQFLNTQIQKYSLRKCKTIMISRIIFPSFSCEYISNSKMFNIGRRHTVYCKLSLLVYRISLWQCFHNFCSDNQYLALPWTSGVK